MKTYTHSAQLVRNVLNGDFTEGIPTWMVHVMDTKYLEHRSGHAPGSYFTQPDQVYIDFQKAAGVCFIDQYLAHNPLSMGHSGYESDHPRDASTGAEKITLDGIVIDSPEAVAEHLERVVLPGLKEELIAVEQSSSEAVASLLRQEAETQFLLGPSILKVPYGDGFQTLPYLRYTTYGYVEYLTAFLLYPELIEQDFKLQAELAHRKNTIAAEAIRQGNLPPVIRLDHDIADSRGPLINPVMLDQRWFPYLARSIQPFLEAGIRLIWHCDGNLMPLLPRFLEIGIGGFQGFQYEDGMDYPAICAMKTRDGNPLMIWAGVSVTRTLPLGTPDDVRRELQWLVKNGPDEGLILGASSSITPGVPWENLDTFLEGLAYYRQHGRTKRG